MKLVIAGSRTIFEYQFLIKAFRDARLPTTTDLEIVSGMALGADSLAIKFAQHHNLKLHKFPADWKTYGRVAGFQRNIEMAKFADACLILWDGQSTGSKHMHQQALKHKLKTFLYLCKRDGTVSRLSN